jgi:hypothetical protein
MHAKSLSTDNDISAGGNLNITGGGAINGGATIGGINNTGDLIVAGTTNFKGGGHDTWFPFSDGTNYIRGPTQIDGNVNFSENITVNGGPWQPDYFRMSTTCDGNILYASSSTTMAYGSPSSNTGDNAKWYWIGNRLYNKQYGTCVQEDGNGNYSLGPYNYSNKYQMIMKVPYDSRYRLFNIGADRQLGSTGTILYWYNGSNGGDCNWFFHDIV